jgi:hypothetical protein
MAKTKSQNLALQRKQKATTSSNLDPNLKPITSKRCSTSPDATRAKKSAKRSAQSIIGSTEKPRRSKRVKQLHLDKRDAIITPSPALLHQTKAKLPQANVTDVATGLLFTREKSGRASTSCLSSLSSSSRFNKRTSASAISIHYPELELPPGVQSILCPYMKEHVTMRRTAIANESKVVKRLEMDSGDTTMAPCSCAFIYNDSSGIVNIESYLATYSQEYIASLYENEFNLEYVPENFFPENLRSNAGDDASASSDFKISSSVKSSDKDSESDSSRFSIGSDEKRKSPRFQSSKSNDDSPSLDAMSGRDSDATSIHDNDESSSFSSLSPSASHSSDASPSSSFSCSQSKASSSRSRVDTLSRQRFQYYMNYVARLQQQRRSDRNSLITSPIRAVLVDWLIEVAEEYRLGGVTLHTAVGLVDRCLANVNCRLVKDVMVEQWDDDWSKKGCKGRQLIIDRKTVQLLGW